MSDQTANKPIEVRSVGAVQLATAVKQALAVATTAAATVGLAPVVTGLGQASGVMACIDKATGGSSLGQAIGAVAAVGLTVTLGWQQLSSRAKAKKAVALAEKLPNEEAVVK